MLVFPNYTGNVSSLAEYAIYSYGLFTLDSINRPHEMLDGIQERLLIA